jgi:penicillin amidase
MRKWLKRIALTLGILLAVVGLLAAGTGLWLHSRLAGSLPLLNGERRLAGLSAPVSIERDELGIPTIRAQSRADVARALGWLHAQDRFFQMDLMRRQAAGEMAALLGANALALDRRHRPHRFRWRARQHLLHTDPDKVRLFEAYAAGVNAGLAALDTPPPEYLLLRVDPEPWRAEDTVLVLSGMFLLLQGDNGAAESNLGLLRHSLPATLFEFLVPAGTEWDAPLLGGPIPAPGIPTAEVVDLRTARLDGALRRPRGTITMEAGRPLLPGSNNWALAGSHTASGGALVANDMHLPLSLPPIWYRAEFVVAGEPSTGGELRVAGITLAGTPAMIGGSNLHIAWGYTNAGVDSRDLVVLQLDPADDGRYLAPDGYHEFEWHEESLAVRGEEPQTLRFRSTIWGPVIDEDARGRPRALRWVAHDPGGVNFKLIDLESCTDVDQAIAVAQRSGIPAQNFVVGDRDGRIAWTVAGMLPRRFGHDGMVPSAWGDGSRGWDGWLDPAEYPRVVDPDDGRVWSANNRVVDASMLPLVGMRGYDMGARAKQIRDDLAGLERATMRDMLAIQLDDRALFLERWRGLLLGVLTDEALAADPRREELRRLLEATWTGRASVDSVAYRLVRAWRGFLARQVFEAILSPWLGDAPPFDFTSQTIQWEGPLWKLVTERPAHLLDPRFETWDGQLLAAVDTLLDYYEENYESGLAERTWGERNTVTVDHPLTRAIPRLAGWLNAEPRPLPGDTDMPRVQATRFGASERFAVTPGREEEGYLHMPGGQSGHPLSPFYRAGHEAWVEGEPTPFLPGPAVHRLTLSP